MRYSIVMVFAAIAVTSFAQTRHIAANKDWKPAEGKWTGTLTYLDYSSGKPFTMPAEVAMKLMQDKIILSYNYPKEPKANGNDTIFLSGDGLQINNADIVERDVMEDGTIKLVTDKPGTDGNDHKPAMIRHYYYVGKNRFQMRKDVRFDGTDTWVKRNEYLFSR